MVLTEGKNKGSVEQIVVLQENPNYSTKSWGNGPFSSSLGFHHCARKTQGDHIFSRYLLEKTTIDEMFIEKVTVGKMS